MAMYVGANNFLSDLIPFLYQNTGVSKLLLHSSAIYIRTWDLPREGLPPVLYQ